MLIQSLQDLDKVQNKNECRDGTGKERPTMIHDHLSDNMYNVHKR